MSTEITRLENPIDVMYLIHKALQTEIVGCLQLTHKPKQTEPEYGITRFPGKAVNDV